MQKTPLEGIKISLVSEADIHQWQIQMEGPKGSAYEVWFSSPRSPSQNTEGPQHQSTRFS